MISDWIDLVNCIDLPDQVHRIDLSNPGHCEGVLGVSECAEIKNDLKHAESVMNNEPSIQSLSIHPLEEKQKGLEKAQKELEEKQKGLEEKQKGLEDKPKELEKAQKELKKAQKELELEKAQNAIEALGIGVLALFAGVTITAIAFCWSS